MTRERDADPPRDLLMALGLLIELGLGLLGALLRRALVPPAPEVFHFGLIEAGLALAGTLPLVLILVAASRGRQGPLGRLRDQVLELTGPLLRACGPIDLAVLAAAAGFGEELLFRGAIQDWLLPRVGAPLAIGLASLAFGLAHPMSRIYVITAAAVGVYLGMIYHVTGNLVVVMAIHGLYDLVALLWLQRQWRETDARPPGE